MVSRSSASTTGLSKGGGMRRWRALGLLALVPILIVVGVALHLVRLAGELPGQVAPTPSSAGVTPFAVGTDAPGRAQERGAPTSGSPETSGAVGIGTPAASPVPGGQVYAIVGPQSQVRYVVQ